MQLFTRVLGLCITLNKTKNQHSMNTTIVDTRELFIKMAVSGWDTQIIRVSKLIDALSDEQLSADVAPGRNSGTYLLGHLIAVSDNILELMGWDKKLYPQLENIFLKNPDKSGLEMPPLSTLRRYWKEINAKISKHINDMSPDDWFSRHTAVSEEDFSKEPHRNKLNVLLSRTTHTSSHLGQLIYLTPIKK